MPIKYAETGRRTTHSDPVHLESIHPDVIVPVSTAAESSLPVQLEGGIKSTGNSTTTPLGAGETFTGEWESIAAYESITVNGGSDVAGTLYVDFSDIPSDSSNGYRSVQLTDGKSGAWLFHVLGQTASYCRSRIVNGGTAQGYVYLELYLHPTMTLTVSRAAQVVNDFYDVLNVRQLSDPRLDEANGKQTDRTVVQKFGANPDVAASTKEDIWYGGGLYTGFLTTASVIRVRAGGNADDDSTGTGARSVMISGLDENWEEVEEEVATNGTAASSPTTTTFIRVFRSYIMDVGAYGECNEGDVQLETTSGTLVAAIEAGLGQTQLAIYTIPANKRGFVRRISATVEGNKAADVYFFQRQDADVVSAPYTAKRLFFEFAQLTGEANEAFTSYIGPFPPKTDVWAQAVGPTGGAGISATFDIVLVPNT